MLIPGARSAHERHDEAQDPRQSRSDTSPPISQATARPPIGRRRETTHPIFLRETETGTKLSLLHAPSRKPGQNSPCTGKTARIPRFWASRGNFVTEMPRRPCAWRILSRTTLRSRYARHVLSGHQLYVRTLTHWLIRPPATPSMGRQHTRGQRGLAAVPVGGGGAWPGFEIDHSEPSGARVAISRAGRRPRAHKAARPWPRAHKAARPWPRAHTAARRLHEHITRPRPVTRPRPRE